MSNITDTATDPAAKPDRATTEPPAKDKPNAEAARYRTQLRDAEAERDTLRGRVETMQRAEVERLAADAKLTVPSAVWRAGVELADLLDDEGNLDPDKASDAITTARDTLGLAVRPGTPKPDPTLGGSGAEGDLGDGTSWADALRS